MTEIKWWQRAVFYQIYPRSFADGNGDGIGDFQGIISKLDHLRDLGIGGIWLSPHFPSPYIDCGYDISDYEDVAPEYGTLADFKMFLDEAHARDIRVILDLVLNHSSDQHPWFQESRSSRDNPKRDWYIWHDGKNGSAPNNWASIFGGSAWEYDAVTEQYYYHAFLKEQPDLNWRNPEVKAAMWDAVRFWLDMGVDGFRLDAVATIYEDLDIPDHTFPLSFDEIPDPNSLETADYYHLMEYQVKRPGLHALLKELRTLIDQYPGDRILVGEDEDVTFHGSGDDELHLVFNFPLMRLKRLTPMGIRANQTLRLTDLPDEAWPCNTLNNHDASRVWTRYGDGQHDAALARLHAALMLTLKGTPFLYYGEEIGMVDLKLTSMDEIRDTAALNLYQRMTQKLGKTADEATEAALLATRDRCRTPMQWNSSPEAGFSPSGSTTWLPIHPNHETGINVADQIDDPTSLLSFYRAVIQLRQATPALNTGDYQVLDAENTDCLIFLRQRTEVNQTCLVALNFSEVNQQIELDRDEKTAHVLFSTEMRSHTVDTSASINLSPFEILIAELA
ncbi:MAG: glucohydrolase [Anaerolineaceae bacterium]|nr:glucohydrolase [Anaerolineaceae bacterium]